jgi:bacteriocin biosynthesis cyclodehydratase domain-containing protein
VRGDGATLDVARLKDTVEAFPASDGNVYIMRGTETAEYVIPAPTPVERALLEALGARPRGEGLRATLERGGISVEPAELGRLLAPLDELGLLREPGDLRSDGAKGRHAGQLLYFADLAPPDGRAEEFQERLRRARVTVLGCGGLGSWTLCALACAGVGELVVVDDDSVELSNLNRQLLFKAADIGRLKVEAAGDALQAFDPELRLELVPRRVRTAADVAEVATGADLVVCTADWPVYEIGRWVNAACVRTGIPHVTAAQFPPFVRVGPLYRPGVTGCLECLERSSRRDFPFYDELIAFRRSRGIVAATLGAASGLIGSLLAMDAIHLLTGLAEPATTGAAVVIDMRTLELSREPVPREPDCPLCGPSR